MVDVMVVIVVVLMVISPAEEMGRRHGGGRSAGTSGSCSRHGVVVAVAEMEEAVAVVMATW